MFLQNRTFSLFFEYTDKRQNDERRKRQNDKCQKGLTSEATNVRSDKCQKRQTSEGTNVGKFKPQNDKHRKI